MSLFATEVNLRVKIKKSILFNTSHLEHLFAFLGSECRGVLAKAAPELRDLGVGQNVFAKVGGLFHVFVAQTALLAVYIEHGRRNALHCPAQIGFGHTHSNLVSLNFAYNFIPG